MDRQIHATNYGVYGIWQIRHALTRAGLQIGREQTARLMRLAGVASKVKADPRSQPAKARGKTLAQTKGNLHGLIHHSDHGSQYVSIVNNDKLTDCGITPSTGHTRTSRFTLARDATCSKLRSQLSTELIGGTPSVRTKHPTTTPRSRPKTTTGTSPTHQRKRKLEQKPKKKQTRDTSG